MDFNYGIEHEIAFLNAQGAFADFSNTPFTDFEQIIADLPFYESDYPQLRVGDAGIKLKRWYIEGYERYNDDGISTSCAPKGIEIRTTIHSSIEGAIDELRQSNVLLSKRVEQAGYSPVLTSFNPWQEVFNPMPPLTPFERKRRAASPEKITADIPMLTYGPDLSLSSNDLSVEQTIDAARKLTYYSPWIIPFSFSSPFYKGKLWKGVSVRTWYRTGARPTVLVFLPDDQQQIISTPSLTQKARIPAEIGRIEFKAFDSCGDFDLYASLFAFLKGLILDKTLLERATIPDKQQHQAVALQGFSDTQCCEQSYQLLKAAQNALKSEAEKEQLQRLFMMLEDRETPADVMIRDYQYHQSIQQTIALKK